MNPQKEILDQFDQLKFRFEKFKKFLQMYAESSQIDELKQKIELKKL